MERSSCDCDRCLAACSTCPGFLAPEDVDPILLAAKALGLGLDQCLRASEGALVIDSATGNRYRIPTIVPAQAESGECVFLKDGLCAIHHISPFGCRYFKVCDRSAPSQEMDAEHRAALRRCQASAAYNCTHEQLRSFGHVAEPLSLRRAKLARRLEECL